jgi:hypothetical protein
MSLSSTASTNKNCATCNYWSGIREIPSIKTSIHVDKTNPAICQMHSHNTAKKTKSTEQCTKWVKWSLI